MIRPYTGATDIWSSARIGTVRFQGYMTYLFAMTNLGIFADRNVRGGKGKSVHATGRACDLGGTPEQIIAAINFLVDHADNLQVEEVHDYGNRVIPGKFGAGWRCDRHTWKAYDKPTIGSPGAAWVHYEIAPAIANDPGAVDAAFRRIFP